MLDYLDEPFADSSALPMYILSRETRRHVTVALSGDGADELFGGYNKHIAWQKSLQNNLLNSALKKMYPFLKILPASRSSFFGNRIRQLQRYGAGLNMSPADRYWLWAGFITSKKAETYLAADMKSQLDLEFYERYRQEWLNPLLAGHDLNHFLLADTLMVLPDDMLVKTDRMSMAHGLEVRVPFLDYRLVEFAFGLQENYKLHAGLRKRILQDAFRDFLPEQLYNRPKKGFEVPLLRWMQNELKSKLEAELFQREMVTEQGVFNYSAIARLRQRLYSRNPGDAHATAWALLVFQRWWHRYFV